MVYSYEAKPGSEESILDRISDICISMKAEDYLQLPDIIYHEVPVELDVKARKAYNDLERAMVLQLPEDEADISVTSAAALSNKLLQLANGVQACYLQCHFTPDTCRNYTVIGTRGRLENYGDYGKDCSIQVWTRRTDRFQLEGDITYRMASPEDQPHGGADPKIVQGFIDLLRHGTPPESTPQGARYAVAAGVRGAESIRSGGMMLDRKSVV